MKHVEQFDQAFVDSASPEDLVAASRAGNLAALQGQRVPISIEAAVSTGEQLTREDVETMTPEAIHEARKAGILSDLLAGRQS